MKLNFNPRTQNQIFHAYRINQSAAAKTGKAAGAGKPDGSGVHFSAGQEGEPDRNTHEAEDEYHGPEELSDQLRKKGRPVDGFHQVPGRGL